jgi:hypothetical protein
MSWLFSRQYLDILNDAIQECHGYSPDCLDILNDAIQECHGYSPDNT